MPFKLNVNDIIGEPISDVYHTIDAHFKCPLKDLTYLSMLVDKRSNEAIRHGVYIIFNDKNQCVYVGKCESSHFVGRLGSHFGMSPNYGEHTFLGKLVKNLGLSEDFDGYVSAVSKIDDYKYMIINANNQGNEFIRKLEKVFMVMYQPTLNNLPKKIINKSFSGTEIFQPTLYQ